MDIFISHITEEAPIALALKDFIEKKFLGQLQVFVSSNLLHGLNWLSVIDSELRNCEVFIVICSPSSLVRPWINFEIGCAWMKQIPIIPICHSEQKLNQLPLPLGEQQGLYLGDESFGQSFLHTLAEHFKYRTTPAMSSEDVDALDMAFEKICILDDAPQIIYSPRERTQLIVNDLKNLLNCKKQTKTVWTSSFLSALAIAEDDECSEEEHLKLLIEERDQLINLARAGCKVKCIISPANKNYIRHAGVPYAIKRTRRLLEYLLSNDESLINIDFAISEYGTNNLYIIDDISSYEGYKNCLQYGYGLTLRQKSPEILKVRAIYEKEIFRQHANWTIQRWAINEDKDYSETQLLHNATINCLEESLAFLDNYPASNFDVVLP